MRKILLVFSSLVFIVVAINFHGSTGYGIEFQEGIIKSWGGNPFQDLMLGLDYVLENHPFIDRERVCGLGASYGGYMANWYDY